jgi:ABC-type amino acid transport substrate-binding protein
MASTAIARAKTEIEQTKARASNIAKKAREGASMEPWRAMPATLAGAAATGAVRAATGGKIFGFDSDIALAAGLMIAGVASGEKNLVRAGTGAACVAVSKYTEGAVSGFMGAKDDGANAADQA